MTGARTSKGPIPRWALGQWVVIVAVLALAMGLGWRDRHPVIGGGDDEATHVILSQSLEEGHFRDEFLVGTPPHAQYPPGNAAWLLILRRFGGADLDVARAANLLLLALTALLIGDAVRRLSSPWVGVGAISAVVLSPTLLDVSGTVLSESPYILLATLSVWATLRADRDTGRRWTAVALVSGLAAFYTRSIGIALLAAIVSWCLVRRRWSRMAVTATVSAIAAGGWFAYVKWASGMGIGRSYARDLTPDPTDITASATDPISRIIENGAAYLLHVPWTLGLPTTEGTVIDNIGWALLLGTCGALGAWVLARKWPAAFASLVLQAAILLGWAWFVPRLVAPLLPLTIGGLLLGAYHLAGRFGPRSQIFAASGLAILLTGTALTAHLQRAKWHGCNRQDAYGDPSCYIAEERAFALAARVIRDGTPEDAIVATVKPATIYHFTGRRAVPYYAITESDTFARTSDLRALGITHVLLDPLLPGRWLETASMLLASCPSLHVLATLEPATMILELGDPLKPGREACEPLADQIEVGRRLLLFPPA